MTTTQADDLAGAPLPAPRRCPYAPPGFYTETRSSGRPRRGTIWDGSNPWLVATHRQVKHVLADPRVRADVTDPAFPNVDPAQPQTQGDIFFRQDGDEHLPIRRILNPDFAVTQVERWRPTYRAACAWPCRRRNCASATHTSCTACTNFP